MDGRCDMERRGKIENRWQRTPKSSYCTCSTSALTTGLGQILREDVVTLLAPGEVADDDPSALDLAQQW